MGKAFKNITMALSIIALLGSVAAYTNASALGAVPFVKCGSKACGG